MEEENTKDMILTVAIRLFAAKGYDGVGVQEICEEAKITKPTLYYYFGSKTGILNAIAQEKGQAFISALSKACEYKHDFQKSLTEIYNEVIQFAKSNPDFFRLHISLLNGPEGSETKLIYQQIIAGINEIFVNFFTSSCQEFGNMKGKEKLYSALFSNNVNSIALMTIQNLLEPSEETIYKIVHSFLYGVAN